MKDSDVRRIKQQRKTNKGNPKVQNMIESGGVVAPPSGSKYGVCGFCGNTFEQPLLKSQNRYAEFTLCPRCRKTNGAEKPRMVSTIEYTPFPWQVEAEKLLDEHRYLILACGARTGKDRFSNMMLIKYTQDLINENRHIHRLDLVPSFLIWVIAPTFPMANQNFRELKSYLPKSWIVKCREADMTFELIGGGIIEVKSAYDEENLVGVGLDFCTITEADRIRNLEGVWANVSMRLISPGRGREKDRKGANRGCGKCIVNSSPTGKGFFYEMWKWGQPDLECYSPDFASMRLPSTANPYVKEEMERPLKTKYGMITKFEYLKKTWPPDRFARDVEGKFVDDTGTVFTDFRKNCVIDLYSSTIGLTAEQRSDYIKEWQTPIKYHSYRIGYDPATGSSADDPAVVVRDMLTNKIVWMQSLYGKSYDQQYDEISYISRRYNYAPCCWLRTGHTAIENQLAKRGVAEIPLNEQGGKKAEYIQSLERAVQNGDVKVLDDGSSGSQKLISEMDDYTEYAKGKYSNNLTPHDDFVSALYAAYYDYSVQSEGIMDFSSLLGSF